MVDALSGADVWARKADVLRARFGALSDAELSDTLREMFRRMDADGSGTLSEEELRAALAELGVQAEPTQVRAMLQVADADGDARVKEDEFVDVISSIRAGASRIQVALRRKGRSPLPALLAGPLILLIEARPATPPPHSLPAPPCRALHCSLTARGGAGGVAARPRRRRFRPRTPCPPRAAPAGAEAAGRRGTEGEAAAGKGRAVGYARRRGARGAQEAAERPPPAPARQRRRYPRQLRQPRPAPPRAPCPSPARAAPRCAHVVLGRSVPPLPPPPSRTNWTRLVPPPVLTGRAVYM